MIYSRNNLTDAVNIYPHTPAVENTLKNHRNNNNNYVFAKDAKVLSGTVMDIVSVRAR